MMTTASIFIVLAILGAIITVIVMEYKEECKVSEKYKQYDIEKLNEIYELEEDGLCNSCSYGREKCLEDGEAHCKKKEDKNVSKKGSV